MPPGFSHFSLLLILILPSVWSFSAGNLPSRVCDTMTPEHGATPQISASPCSIMTSQSCYRTGDTVTVTLKANGNTNFKGFLLLARSAGVTTSAYGTFSTTSADQELKQCFGTPNSAVNHNNNNPKTEMVFNWMSSPGDNVDITFTYTVVQSASMYWVAQTSSVLTYNPDCIPTVPTTAVMSTKMTTNSVTVMAESNVTMVTGSNDTMTSGSMQTTTTVVTSHSPRLYCSTVLVLLATLTLEL